MSSRYLGILIAISLIISFVYYFGYRKNIRIMKTMAIAMEKAFKPKDKTYTYLGGVLGFSVNYQLEGFRKVMANLRLIPRQSALYLPFMFLTSGKDNLQLLFYTKKPLKCEFHLVKKNPLRLTKPKIYSRDKLSKEQITINGVPFEMLYETKDFDRKFLKIPELLPIKYLNHIAITTDNNIVYVQLLFCTLPEETLIECLSKLTKFLKDNYA